jgi:hypothetical protein
MLSEKSLIRESELQNFLLVEGIDDYHVCSHLLKNHRIPEKYINIIDKKGIDNLLETLDVELIGSGERRLGIVVDADTNFAARWEALRNILIRSGYTMPLEPNLVGTIIEQEGLPVVGLWFMPNNKFPGMLEDFVSFLVPPGDLLWPMAEDILQKVIEKGRRFRETYLMKAQLHTWLAWQEQPGTPLGLAITNRYLDANAPHAQQLIAWIRRLFSLEQHGT